MAKLAALTILLAMAMATILSVHGTRTLERADQVTILEVFVGGRAPFAPSLLMVHLKKRQLAPSQQDAKPVIVTKRHQCLSLWMTSLKKQQVAPSQRGTTPFFGP
nr:unnamed protein product [Digitaria exilis]